MNSYLCIHTGCVDGSLQICTLDLINNGHILESNFATLI